MPEESDVRYAGEKFFVECRKSFFEPERVQCDSDHTGNRKGHSEQDHGTDVDTKDAGSAQRTWCRRYQRVCDNKSSGQRNPQRQLREELQQTLGVALPELSMGMTDDYPVAIEEGATLVRVGRAIFGER